MKEFILDQFDSSGRKLEAQRTVYAKNVEEAIEKANEMWGDKYIHREIK